MRRLVKRILCAGIMVIFVGVPVLSRVGGTGYGQLPYAGKNFIAYSFALYGAGRCYLLTPVRDIVVDAYKVLEQTLPDREFVYMEMGWKGGGRFYPHRTHRKGVSADFLTPMLCSDTKKSVLLPLAIWNLWGYNLRLTKKGIYEDLYLDIHGMIQHLKALDFAARQRGWRVQRVIFDPPLLDILKKNAEFSAIKHIPFMTSRAWFPHDSHYHVDFVSLSASGSKISQAKNK